MLICRGGGGVGGLKLTAAMEEIETLQLRASSLREWAERRSPHPRPLQGLGGVKSQTAGLLSQSRSFWQDRELHMDKVALKVYRL